MKRPRRNIWLFLAIAGGIAYPFIVYAAMGTLPLWVFLALGLGVIGFRLYGMRKDIDLGFWGVALVAVAFLLILLFMKNALGAVQAYPVIIGLSFAAVFGFSLLHPPTVAERIARLSEPDLPPAGVRYTRRVTWVWFVFLLGNAAVSVATIIWGTLAQWTLWNGLISYLLMGLLFVGEYAVRNVVRR